MPKKRPPAPPPDPDGWRGMSTRGGRPMGKPGRKKGFKMPKNMDNVDPETGEIIDPDKPWGTKPPPWSERKNHSKDRIPTPENTPNRNRGNGKLCGAKRRGRMGPAGVCCQPAGWGTDHTGYGHCRYHAGCTPAGNIYAAREMMKEMVTNHLVTLGMPEDVGPHEALLAEVQRTAGHVGWLNALIQEMGIQAEEKAEQQRLGEGGDPDADPADTEQGNGMRQVLTQFTNLGMRPSVWMDIYQSERKHLVDVSKACIAAGVAERQVRIAEDQGKLFAMVLLGIMRDPDLELTPAQQLVAKKVMRRHLATLPTVEAVKAAQATDEELKAITERAESVQPLADGDVDEIFDADEIFDEADGDE